MDPLPPRTRNPHTKARIDTESFWQIWLPIGFGALLVIVAFVAMIPSGSAGIRRPIADLSLVALIVVWAAIALIGLVVVVALIAGLAYLLRESPFWFKRGQDITWIVSQQTQSTTRQVADAVTSANASVAGLARLIERIRDLFPKA